MKVKVFNHFCFNKQHWKNMSGTQKNHQKPHELQLATLLLPGERVGSPGHTTQTFDEDWQAWFFAWSCLTHSRKFHKKHSRKAWHRSLLFFANPKLNVAFPPFRDGALDGLGKCHSTPPKNTLTRVGPILPLQPFAWNVSIVTPVPVMPVSWPLGGLLQGMLWRRKLAGLLGHEIQQSGFCRTGLPKIRPLIYYGWRHFKHNYLVAVFLKKLQEHITVPACTSQRSSRSIKHILTCRTLTEQHPTSSFSICSEWCLCCVTCWTWVGLLLARLTGTVKLEMTRWLDWQINRR